MSFDEWISPWKIGILIMINPFTEFVQTYAHANSKSRISSAKRTEKIVFLLVEVGQMGDGASAFSS